MGISGGGSNCEKIAGTAMFTGVGEYP